MSADPRRGPLDPRLLRRAPSARPWVAAVVLVSGAQALVTVLVAGVLAVLVTALVALEDPTRAGALPLPGAGVGTWLGLLAAALGLRAAPAWGACPW